MTGEIHALVIPKYGMVMTEGVLAAWHVEEGREIKPGDEIIDIETEKIVNYPRRSASNVEGCNSARRSPYASAKFARRPFDNDGP